MDDIICERDRFPSWRWLKHASKTWHKARTDKGDDDDGEDDCRWWRCTLKAGWTVGLERALLPRGAPPSPCRCRWLSGLMAPGSIGRAPELVKHSLFVNTWSSSQLFDIKAFSVCIRYPSYTSYGNTSKPKVSIVTKPFRVFCLFVLNEVQEHFQVFMGFSRKSTLIRQLLCIA